jgi:hypothetical protein
MAAVTVTVSIDTPWTRWPAGCSYDERSLDQRSDT